MKPKKYPVLGAKPKTRKVKVHDLAIRPNRGFKSPDRGQLQSVPTPLTDAECRIVDGDYIRVPPDWTGVVSRNTCAGLEIALRELYSACVIECAFDDDHPAMRQAAKELRE